MRLDFNEDADGKFASYVTTLIQDGDTLTLDSTGCSDAAALQAMTEDMKKMVLVISNWAQEGNWLQHGTCDKTLECPNQNTFEQTISNIVITSKPGVTN